MHSKEWGQYAWYTIHLLTLMYNPSENKKFYKGFIEHIGNALPCPVCRNHFKLRATKPIINKLLESQDIMVNWFHELHNHLNLVLGKKKLSLKEAKKLYINSDGNMIINEKKIQQFLKYIIHDLPRHSNHRLNHIRGLVHYLMIIYPIKSKREINIMDIKTTDELYKWFDNFKKK